MVEEGKKPNTKIRYCMKLSEQANPEKYKVDYWFPEAGGKGKQGVTA